MKQQSMEKGRAAKGRKLELKSRGKRAGEGKKRGRTKRGRGKESRDGGKYTRGPNTIYGKCPVTCLKNKPR